MARVRNESTESTASPKPSRGTDSDNDAGGALVPRPRTRREPAAVETPRARRDAESFAEPSRARGSVKRRRPEVAAQSSRWGQVGLLAVVAGALFAGLALATWSPTDPSLSVAASGPVGNAGGPTGAYLADFLYQVVGWGAWCVLVVGAWAVLRLAGRLAGSWWNALVGTFGLWMVATGIELLAGGGAGRSFPVGGLVGLLTENLLTSGIGRAGTGIVVGLGVLVALTVLFGINWQPIAAKTVDRVQSGTPRAARAIGSVVASAGRGAISLGARAGQAVRGRAQDESEEEFEDDRSESSAVGPLVVRPLEAPAAPALVGMGPALPALPVSAGSTRSTLEERVSRPRHDIPAPRESVWSEAAAPIPRVRLEEGLDAPTQVGSASFVRAEWATESGLPTPSVHPPEPARRAGASRAPAEVDAYDVPSPRAVASLAHERGEPRSSEPAHPQRNDLDELGLESGGNTHQSLAEPSDPPSNAFGFVDEPDAEPLAFRPIVPERPMDPPPPPRAAKGRRGSAAVLPGDLSSGGVNDDGGAVRASDSPFQLPPLSLLDEHPAVVGAADESRLHELATKLTTKLRDFQVEGKITAIRPGPVITSFEYEPAPGIKISKIAGLEKDVAMALMATAIRIVAPVPGRGVVGFEIPNDSRQTVWARDVFASAAFRDSRHILPIMLGKDTEGRPYATDLAKAPHLLVGGTTGAGKSVGVNVMLTSLIMTRPPSELRLILIDPKTTELAPYKEIPHLLHPVVTEVALAAKVLEWTCQEMDRRYKLLADWKVRGIEGYNEKVAVETASWTPEKARHYFPDWPAGELLPQPKTMPYIVVVIDELADLMMQVGKDVETSIARIAQKARASGIHLIIATQSPRSSVLTGLIKGNMPTRLAYRVGSGVESRIVLDSLGAQALLNKGDQLFMSPANQGLLRVHGPFLDDREVERITDFCRAQGKPQYAPAIRMDDDEDEFGDAVEELPEDLARHYDQVLEFAVQKGTISTSNIQRFTKLGYNKACIIMEHLEANGVVSPADGAKPRKVLIREVGEHTG